MITFTLRFAYRLGDGLVGEQHEFLDEFVSIFRYFEISLHGLAVLVDVEMEFLTVELHGAVLEAGSTEFLGKGVEGDQLQGVIAF